MKEIDLLFIPRNKDNYAQVADEYLEDIEISCLHNILLADEYNLFTSILAKPLTDQEKIYERQKIFQDLMKYNRIGERLISVCEQVEKNFKPKLDIMYSQIPLNEKLKEYLKIIDLIVDVPQELLAVINEKSFTSITLSKLCEQLAIQEETKRIKELLENLVSNIVTNNVSLQLQYGKTFKLDKASVYRSSRGYSKKLFTKSSLGASYGHDFIADLQVNEILGSGAYKILYFMNNLHKHILSYCKSLAEQLSFYVAGIKIIKYFQNLDINVIFPEFTQGNEIIAKGLMDIGLKVKNPEMNVVPNDFHGKSKFFYLISGVNQGGKTTFLKSIGLAQIFAQNGLPVVANRYICPIFSNFVTHFPREEDSKLDSGKLEEELLRFKKNLSLMKNNALILMNESFASTTEKEGAEIAIDILRSLSIVKPFIFFVTHNYYLLKNRNEIQLENNISICSLVTIKGDSASSRTYKLEEGEPHEEIDTIEFLKEKYMN